MKYSRGFIAIPPLPLWVYAGIASLFILLFGVVQTHRLHASEKAFSAFRAQVKAEGEAAEKRAQERIKRDLQAKESTDAQNRKLRAANDALSRSLLDARTSRGYLPAPAPGTASPDRVCFARTEFERTIRELDEQVSGLIGEGDQARIGLDSAKDWAKALK